MSYFKVTEPNVADVTIDDLGIVIAQNTVSILSDNFSVSDMYLSADLEAAIINGDLDVDIDYGTGFQSVAAGDYTNRDCLASFLNVYEITNENNNEDLVDGTDVSTTGPGGNPLHIHDARYYTETELGATTAPTGGSLIGLDDVSWDVAGGFDFDDLQEFVDDLYIWHTSGGGMDDLDTVYTNDSDGIMNVNGTTKDLDLKSNNVNDIIISRTDTTVHQNALLFDVSDDELKLGSLAVSPLAQVDVRVLSDLYVDGNITFVGTITDTTVNNMNVTNSEILMRDGAATGGDARVKVERGSTGADANLYWNETTDRWMGGLEGSEGIIGMIDWDEDVSGVWTFTGSGDTEPNFILTEKSDAAPPSTNLGAAGEIPISMFENGIQAVYDKSNSRDKWLSVNREMMEFAGRDHTANKNEYLRTSGAFTSNQTGNVLSRKATLIGITINAESASTWTAEVRKNGAATVLASLASGGAKKLSNLTLDVDFAADDEVQVYCNSGANNIPRPWVKLEFAYLFSA